MVRDLYAANETQGRVLRRTAPFQRRSSLRSETLEVIADNETGKQWHEVFLRFSSAKINNLRLCPSEHRALQKRLDRGLAPRAAKYICWRRSLLKFSFIPFVATTCLQLIQLWTNSDWNSFRSTITSFLPFVQDKHTLHFKNLFYMWVAQNIIYSITMLGTVLCVLLGMIKWPIYTVSRSSVRNGYVISLVLPFIVLLFIPFRQSVDFKSLQTEICEEKLGEILNSSLLPPSGIDLNAAEVCIEPPSEWVPTIKAAIRSSGLEINSTTHTCDNAMRAYKEIQEDASVPIADKVAFASVCTSSKCRHCFDNTMCVSMAASILYGDSKPHECASCYKKEDSLGGHSCMDLCQEYFLPQAMSATNAYCVNEILTLQLEALSNFIVQIEYAQYLVGGFIGATTLQTLFPSSFSLMFGSIRGARVAKGIACWSRLPGYAMGAAVTLGMPMLAAMMITLQQALGDAWSMLALVFMFASVFIWYPAGDFSHGNTENDNVGLIEPQNYQVAINELAVRNRMSFLSKIVSLTFVVLFITNSDVGQVVKSEVETYVLENGGTVISRLGRSMMTFFLDIFGRSLLSAVVFSDLCMDIFTNVTTGDLKDTDNVKSSRNDLAWTINTLMHPTLVHPKLSKKKKSFIRGKASAAAAEFNPVSKLSKKKSFIKGKTSADAEIDINPASKPC